jgi:hypothetical protein
VLVLHKQDFNMMMDDFPQYGHMWKKAIIRKEVLRKALLHKLTCGMSYRTLAAVTIQRNFRQKCLHRRSKSASQDPIRISESSSKFRTSKAESARSSSTSNTKSKAGFSVDSSAPAASGALPSAKRAPVVSHDTANVQVVGALCKEVRHVCSGQDALRLEMELLQNKLVQVQSTLSWLSLRDGFDDPPLERPESESANSGGKLSSM